MLWKMNEKSNSPLPWRNKFLVPGLVALALVLNHPGEAVPTGGHKHGPSINLDGAKLTFQDDFKTFISSPDGSRGWKTQGGNNWRALPGQSSYYSDASVGVNPFSNRGGILTITAAPGHNLLGLPYNSGIITTLRSFSQQYGYFEVSAKLPAGAGLWPAIWLLPTNLGWPPEIDIMEMLGNNPDVIYSSIHTGPGNASKTIQARIGDTTRGFHTYGVDWEPDTITYYFDRRQIGKLPTPPDMHQPMYLLINLGVGEPGSWPGAPKSAAEFPARMQIAYVRIYRVHPNP
jgi:beta-glucanase (GH16 family)